MFLTLLILSTLALFWWGLQLFAPSQRFLHRFVYSAETSPDVLNAAFPNDGMTELFSGDPADGMWPSVTIVVPGRNEGHLLGRTLGSLCAMDYPSFRVIFVDDQSTDSTAEVCCQLEARFSNLTVINNTEAPRDGWIGKTWAVHQAEPHMHGSDYLLFTDSDLEFHPQCLRHMVRLARHRRTDVTSLLPRMICRTHGELLGLLGAMCIINSRLSLYHTNNPKIPRALVAGGFLMVKRTVYHELGGHASVRGQVVEDVAFGTRAKVRGKRVFTALTHNLYFARMYEGWIDTFRGLKKNAYAGANYNPLFAAAVAAFLLFVGTLPLFYALASILLYTRYPSTLSLAAMLIGGAAAVLQMLSAANTARFVAFRPSTALLIAPAFAFYFAVFLGSVLDYYCGGNTWAGRQVKNAQPLNSAAKAPDS